MSRSRRSRQRTEVRQIGERGIPFRTHEKSPPSNMKLWLMGLLLIAWLGRAGGTSLMKRIRERQSAEDAVRGLDVTGENWIQVPQPVQDVLASIDDKLRGLDTFGYTLKLARLDFSLDQMVRRMENIETKLGRLETMFDLRMEKVEEVVVSKDIKEEFSNEHLSRRMESLNEKINTKAAYLDAKLDIKLERVMSKLELLERDLHNSVDDILERLIKNDERRGAMESERSKKDEKIESIDSSVKNLDSYVKGELTDTVTKHLEGIASKMSDMQTLLYSREVKSEQTLTDIQTNMTGNGERMLKMLLDSNDKIDNLSATLRDAGRARSSCEVNRSFTQEQLENLTAILEKTLSVGEAKFDELDSDVQQYTKKVINGIQELWKTSDELKSDISTTLEQGGKIREMLRREFQRLHEQIEPLPKLEPRLADISEDLDKKVSELSATVDTSFASLLVAQNTFIDSCKRIQQDETHIYDILQQIVYEMRNRSTADIQRIASELQAQSAQINTSLAQVLTAVHLNGNITVNTVIDLQGQVKPKDQCLILRTERIDWNLVESICSQLPMVDNNNRRNSLLGDSNTDDFLSNLSIQKDKEKDPDNDRERSPLNVNEYDMDYHSSDAEYNENL